MPFLTFKNFPKKHSRKFSSPYHCFCVKRKICFENTVLGFGNTGTRDLTHTKKKGETFDFLIFSVVIPPNLVHFHKKLTPVGLSENVLLLRAYCTVIFMLKIRD